MVRAIFVLTLATRFSLLEPHPVGSHLLQSYISARAVFWMASNYSLRKAAYSRFSDVSKAALWSTLLFGNTYSADHGGSWQPGNSLV